MDDGYYIGRLGDLNADNLGDTITFSHGGATYRGVLREVQHTISPFNDTVRTMVHLRSGDWKLFEHFDPDIAYSGLQKDEDTDG